MGLAFLLITRIACIVVTLPVGKGILVDLEE